MFLMDTERNRLPILESIRTGRTKEWWQITSYITLQEALFWVAIRMPPPVGINSFYKSFDSGRRKTRFDWDVFGMFGKKYSYKIKKEFYAVDYENRPETPLSLCPLDFHKTLFTLAFSDVKALKKSINDFKCLSEQEKNIISNNFSRESALKEYEEKIASNPLFLKTEQEAYKNKKAAYEKWEQIIESMLFPHKTDLYSKFATGKLIGYGKIRYLDEILNTAGTKNYEEIYKSEWDLQKIDWQKNSLETPQKIFSEILLGPQDLIKFYPAPSWYSEVIETFWGEVIEVQKTERRGRKRTNYWDAFHVEVAKYILEKGKLPSQQSELVRHCQQWFSDTFGEEPAESEIKEKISLYYKTLGT